MFALKHICVANVLHVVTAVWTLVVSNKFN